MRKLIRILERAFRRLFPQPRYVIVYDRVALPGDEDPETEEYYGYFGSPDEARSMWRTFASDGTSYANVKLCRIVDHKFGEASHA